MIARRVHNHVMESVLALLRGDANLSGVTVVGQDEQELSAIIQTEEAKLDGLVVVVTVDTVAKRHSKPATWDVHFTASVTEVVPVNRENDGYLSAIDVAMECGEAIDAAGIGHFDSLRHTTPGDGVLNAVAECSGQLVLKAQ